MLRERLHHSAAAVCLAGLLAVGCPDGSGDEGECKAGLLAGDLVVTEIMANPAGTDDGKEWFEIHNPTSAAIDLTGVRLEAAKADGLSDKSHLMGAVDIQPGQYLVLGGVLDEVKPDYVDYAYAADLGGLYNGSGRITLYCNEALVDRVVYAEMPDGRSLGFDGALPPDSVVNDDLDSWCESEVEYETGSFGTPGTANEICEGVLPPTRCMEGDQERDVIAPLPGDLVITEFMANPSGTDGGKEWFEVYVGRNLDLNGLRLGTTADDLEDQVSSLACVPVFAGTYLVFAASDDPVENGGLPRVDWIIDFSLGNTSGELYLAYGEQMLDGIAWTGSLDGASTSLEPTLVDPDQNDDESYWCAGTESYGDGDLGTPGAANPSCGISPEGKCYEGDSLRDLNPPAAGNLVITEFMANPSGTDGDNEWFEVYVTANVDLNHLQVGKTPGSVEFSLPGGECLAVAAGTYVVFAPSADPLLNGGLPRVDFLMDMTLGNANSGFFVGYEDQVLDAITYTSTTSGASTALEPRLTGTDENDDENYWCAGSEPYGDGDLGTPGAANTPCGISPAGQCYENDQLRDLNPPVAGDLVITEFMANPSGTDGGKEWFEVYVAADVDLNHLQVGKTTPGTVEFVVRGGDCLSVDAGTYFVFAASDDPAVNGGLPQVDLLLDMTLANTDSGIFVGYSDEVFDAITYASAASGASTALEPRLTDPAENDNESYWCAGSEPYGDGDLGTPGADNTSCGIAPAGRCYENDQPRDLVSPVAGDLVITEFMANPDAVGDAVGEWFEVYVAADVDLNHLQVGKTPGTVEFSVRGGDCLAITAGSFVVFAASDDPLVNGNLPGVDFLMDMSLGNTGPGIFVGYADEVLDEITYTSAYTGASTALEPNLTDPVENDNVLYWCEGSELYGDGDLGTPGAVNTSCGIAPAGQCFDAGMPRDKVPPVDGDLVITEFMANPSGTDGDKEWFEVYVDADVDLNGLQLGEDPAAPDDSLPEGDCLAVTAGSYVVFAASDDPAINGGLLDVDFTFDFSLTNSDSGLFVGLGGVALDQITWTTTTEGAATSLDPADWVTWCPAADTYGDGDLGTPGTANPSCP